MFLQYRFADAQAQPSSAPGALSCVERIEDVKQAFRRDAGSIILKDGPDRIVAPSQPNSQRALFVNLAHGLLGIDDKVPEDLD